MPSGFEWSTVDLQDPRQLDEVYSLLSAHYVEDDAGFSRLNPVYSCSAIVSALNTSILNSDCVIRGRRYDGH